MRGLRWRGIELWIVIALASSHVALADKQTVLSDPDTQAARRHYDRGVQLYDAQKYADAVGEFETAKRIKPLPAFDYNIGRCRDRLEEWAAAADAYERFVASTPNAPEAAELRARIVTLRERARSGPAPVATAPAPAQPVAPPPAKPSASPPLPTEAAATTASEVPALIESTPQGDPSPKTPLVRKWWLWTAVGVVAVAGVAVGLGVGLSESGGSKAPVPMTTDGNFAVTFP